MAAQPGEGATQLGVCVLCGEELDLHEAQLVEVRCNKHKHGCDDQLFHSDCVIDLIDRRAGSRRCVACPGEDSTRPLGLQRCPVPHHRGRAADARLACGSIRVSRTFYLKKSTYFDLAGASLQTTVSAQALGGALNFPCALRSPCLYAPGHCDDRLRVSEKHDGWPRPRVRRQDHAVNHTPPN